MTPSPRPSADRAATYVYCVVRSARPPDLQKAPPGLPGTGRPRAVTVRPTLWLVVATAPLPRYGEAALARVVRDLDEVSRSAVAHSAVVTHCARRYPTLPMRLLTLFASDARAAAAVRRRGSAVAKGLGRVAGRAEWGVQVRPDGASGPVARQARATARRETAGLSPGTRFLERRRRHREAHRELSVGARAAAGALYRALAGRADEARRRPLVSAAGRPALLLDAAFLVPATRATRFRQAVRALAAGAADRGLRVRLTGPWPPYSFVAGRL